MEPKDKIKENSFSKVLEQVMSNPYYLSGIDNDPWDKLDFTTVDPDSRVEGEKCFTICSEGCDEIIINILETDPEITVFEFGKELFEIRYIILPSRDISYPTILVARNLAGEEIVLPRNFDPNTNLYLNSVISGYMNKDKIEDLERSSVNNWVPFIRERIETRQITPITPTLTDTDVRYKLGLGSNIKVTPELRLKAQLKIAEIAVQNSLFGCLTKVFMRFLQPSQRAKVR